MTEVPKVNQIQNPNMQNSFGLQPNGSAFTTANGQSVTITPSGNSSQIYQYPASSLYNPNQQASGVNIYICNPSGYTGTANNSACPSTPMMTYPGATQVNYPWAYNTPNNPSSQIQPAQPLPAAPISNTPIAEETNDKTKNKKIVELTNDYIKRLEEYLKNSNSQIRRQGIEDLIKRFEEDETRADDPALTALLNIALQDPNASNRMLAMSPIICEVAKGDKNTEMLLKKLINSKDVFGQEAKNASNALLKANR